MEFRHINFLRIQSTDSNAGLIIGFFLLLAIPRMACGLDFIFVWCVFVILKGECVKHATSRFALNEFYCVIVLNTHSFESSSFITSWAILTQCEKKIEFLFVLNFLFLMENYVVYFAVDCQANKKINRYTLYLHGWNWFLKWMFTMAQQKADHPFVCCSFAMAENKKSAHYTQHVICIAIETMQAKQNRRKENKKKTAISFCQDRLVCVCTNVVHHFILYYTCTLYV